MKVTIVQVNLISNLSRNKKKCLKKFGKLRKVFWPYLDAHGSLLAKLRAPYVLLGTELRVSVCQAGTFSLY